MAVNQRIMAKPIGSGTAFMSFKADEMVLVYKPMTDPANGSFVLDTSGGAMVQRVGGVRAGSKGTIQGPSIKVPRRCLIEYKDVPQAMGVDLIDLYPIQFDDYSGVGYLLGDCLKIV